MTRTTLTDQRYRELTDMPKFRRVQILNGDPALMDAYRNRVRAAAASIDRRRARDDRERENMQITRERAAEIAADLTASLRPWTPKSTPWSVRTGPTARSPLTARWTAQPTWFGRSASTRRIVTAGLRATGYQTERNLPGACAAAPHAGPR